jgi:hypothetical protein
MTSNNCFNLINPLAWFLREDHAKTMPSPSGTDLKVKPMLGGRLRRKMIHVEVIAKNVNLTSYVDKEAV